MKRFEKRHGWTRLEALGLTLVFGVLAVVILPAFAQFGIFTRARENARRASCRSNLQQIGLGLMQYTQDYDEKFPPATGRNTGSASAYNNEYGWASNIQPYVKSTQLFQCPSDKHAAKTDATRTDATKAGYTDYWYNRNFSRLTFAALVEPSLTFLSGDGDGGSTQSNARYNLNVLPGAWWKTPGSPARRHRDMGNYLFGDGHVKALPLSDIGKTTGYGFKAKR